MRDLFRQNFEIVFEMCVLVVVFVLGALLLAWFPENENLSNWIMGGVVIGALARALGTRSNGNGSGKL